MRGLQSFSHQAVQVFATEEQTQRLTGIARSEPSRRDRTADSTTAGRRLSIAAFTVMRSVTLG